MYLDLAVGKWPNGTPSRDHYSSFDLKKTISSNLVFFSQLRDKFVNIRSKLSELSNCQAIILGNQYDLQYVTEILHAIDRRLELWKYCDASSHTIREWLQTVFKKVIIQVLNSDSSYRQQCTWIVTCILEILITEPHNLPRGSMSWPVRQYMSWPRVVAKKIFSWLKFLFLHFFEGRLATKVSSPIFHKAFNMGLNHAWCLQDCGYSTCTVKENAQLLRVL